MILPQFEAFVKRHALLEPGQLVLVAVSGGPDSVALLHLLTRLRMPSRPDLHIIHVDHGLRPDAGADVQFVQQLGQKWDVPVTVVRVDVRARRRGGESIQQAARRLRFAAFRDVAGQIDAQRIALGHHQDDQAETVLLRLIRGAGMTGLGGMRPRRGPFIRPLLHVSRAEIERYCNDHRLDVLHDASNTSSVYTRNRVRSQLLPLLEATYNPNVIEGLARTAELLQADDALLESMAKGQYDSARVGAAHPLRLRIEVLRRQPDALRRRIVRRALRDAGADLGRVTYDHTDAVLALVEDESAGAVTLPGPIRVERDTESLIFGAASGNRSDDDCAAHDAVALPNPLSEREVHVPGRTGLGPGLTLEVTFSPPANFAVGSPRLREAAENRPMERASERNEGSRPVTAEGAVVLAEGRFDADALHMPLFVRSREDGDRLRPIGLGGTKKLQDLFVDEKVPRHARDRVPLVLDQAGVIWVPGLRVDERVVAGPHSRNILHMRITSL